MKKIKKYCSIFVIIALFFVTFAFLFVSCPLGDDQFMIEADKMIVRPTETINFKVTKCTGKLDSSKTVWYVNGVRQTETGSSFSLVTDNVEKRYTVMADGHLSNGARLFGVTVNCYATNNEKLLKTVYEYVDKWNYNSAISVSVFGSDISFNYAGGYASLSTKLENTETTPHILYSITKSFTAASILKLKKEGKLELSDRLDKYVTGLSDIYVNNDATIEELLTHRSGIADYTSNPQIIINNPFKSNAEWNAEKILDYIESPADERGKLIYSSTNYIILGMIIEEVAGIPLNQYISENFLTPLGLTDLKVAPQDSIVYQSLAHPHAYPGTFMGLVGDGINPIDINNIISDANEMLAKCGWAAGGMVGTSDKAAKWGYNLLSSNGSVDSDIRNTITGSLSGFTESDSPSVAYGIATRKLFHNGKEFIGSYGRSIGDENLMFYNPDKDVCITILS